MGFALEKLIRGKENEKNRQIGEHTRSVENKKHGKRNSRGRRDGWTCCTNHEFIVNSSRIFQVISSVMSEGYGRPSASNRVVARGEQAQTLFI